MLSEKRTRLARCRRELYRWAGVAPRFHARTREVGSRLIHAHFAEGASPAMFMSDRLDLPMILHLRGGAELLPDAQLRRHLFEFPFLAYRRRVWQRASLFLCVSNYIREKAIRAGFPEDKIRVQYTGMDCDAFSPKMPLSEKDPNLVLYVGRLVPYKGCDYLLRAMQIVRQRRPQARLVVIGDGVFRVALEQMNRELGVRATFLGEQKQPVIREWLERARVFCAPSVTLDDGMSEAFGNVFTESQCMGVPVVSTRHGGIPETTQEGVTGLLASERDFAMLAEHLNRYLTDDAFWAHSRLEGMQWIRRQFDVRTQTEKLETIYDHVIQSFQPGSRFQHA
jgi:glycosyltransferase involved in cell wall biosynthesis